MQQDRTKENNMAQHRGQDNTHRVLIIITLISLVAAYLIGVNRSKNDISLYLPNLVENADRFVKQADGIYSAIIESSKSAENDDHQAKTYISMTEANGYGGPMKVLVAVDELGFVSNILVIENRETPSWYRKVIAEKYPEKLKNKSYKEHFELGRDIDGISGATYTSRAIAEAVRKGVRDVASARLGYEVEPEKKPDIEFGIPELSLILFFSIGLFSGQKKYKYKKQVRWLTLISGMILLGFIFERPLNLVHINKFLIGFWPDWKLYFYWYLLIFGVFSVLIIKKVNVYCTWVCPFGATQECLGKMGRAKQISVGKYAGILRWINRGVVWLAIVIALIYRNPGLSSYEVFGTLFSLTGTNLQFLLLTIIVLMSLFVKRPWCTFFCPIRSIEQFIRVLRKEMVLLWEKTKNV
jgi:NosR/NirI family nitrous oxide reductase transcriptional regulator